MSDPRFARLKTDPRFRKPKKHQSKVVVDERFKSVFVRDKKHGRPKHAPRVDKFGRRLADDHDKDNLRRFYRLENQDAEESTNGPDYARGEVLFESSDEDEDGPAPLDDEDSDVDHVVTLGGEDARRQSAHGEHEDFEVDLDESSFADLDAQAAAYSKAAEEEEDAVDDNTIRTRRLAAVNLDWDHVRASHLFKIFDSILPSSSGTSSHKGVAAPIIRGKVLSVRVYPSRFGKDRMEREEREGPPAELFRRKRDIDEEEIDEKNIYETGDADEYDDDALRKYQLERLRYYYAVIECDNVQVASHIYSELQGTELERSANVFDLTFIPDDMVFDDDFRDEATAVGLDIPYKALDFATDALRHSKVKLTWDQEDPERSRVTRRALTKKEAEEGDFHVYIASSSGSESEPAAKRTQGIDREKMRALLLGGSQSDLPEGWGNTKSGGGDEADDVDMEVTFMPALSSKPQEEETTLDKYQRKMREKRKKRKEEWKAKAGDSEGISETRPKTMKDDFFGESDEEENKSNDSTAKGSASDGRHKSKDQRRPSTEGELTLLTTADGSDDQAKHFDMKAVLKAEKGKKSRKTKWTKKNHSNDEANELQEDFTIDVKDERFRALHDDHRFAIDPSNPQFKKTKSMSALLDERSKRQQRKRGDHLSEQSGNAESGSAGNLQSLVESVKRKSISHQRGTGKRRRT